MGSGGFRAVVRTLRHAKECGDSDKGLVERAVRNASLPGQPRWVAVKRTFAVGSTSAHALCRRFGLDPDEEAPNAD